MGEGMENDLIILYIQKEKHCKIFFVLLSVFINGFPLSLGLLDWYHDSLSLFVCVCLWVCVCLSECVWACTCRGT